MESIWERSGPLCSVRGWASRMAGGTASAWLASGCWQASWREVSRLVLALILIAGGVVFTTLFEQAGSSMNLFAARNTQLTIGGVAFTAGQTQSFNAGMILLLAPIFSFIWAFLGKRRMD